MEVRKDGKPPDPEPPKPRGNEARVDPPKNDEDTAVPAPPASNGDIAFGIEGESQDEPLPSHPSPSGSLLSLSPLPVQGEEQGDEGTNDNALPGTKSRSDKAIESIASGVWDTAGARKLRDTLTRDWANDTADPEDPELAQWRVLALQPYPLRSDDNLRPPSQEEKHILEAYLAQRIELPHPPFFVNEILTTVQRTQIRQFHDDYLLYRLTATVPPAVNISANVAHKTIMTQLFAANTRPGFGQDMFKKLMSDIERVTYDGSHLLTFVFASKSRAKPWANTTLRFQRSILTLKDTTVLEHSKQTGEITMEQKELCYTVRVLADSEVSAVDLHLILSQLSKTKVVEVARPIKAASNLIHDNNYWNVTFYSTSCPQTLLGVTCVVVGTKALLLHHYQTFLRIPCFKCYSPRHSAPKCTASTEQCKTLRTRFTKHFRGKVDKTPMLSPTKVTKANYEEFEKLMAKAAAEFATAVSHSLEAEAKMLEPANEPSAAGATTKLDTSGTTGTSSSALPEKGQNTNQRDEKHEVTVPSKPKKLSKKAKRQLRFDTFVNANRFSPLDDEAPVDEDEPTEHAAEGAPQILSAPATCSAQDEDGDVDMTDAGAATPVKQQQRSIASDGLKSGVSSAAVAIFDMPASLNSSSARSSSQLSHQSLDLEVVKVKPGDQPRKLEFFLVPFHGKKQEVPADGNCMLYAYHATVTDCAATGFKRTPAVVHGLNSLKRDLYTLMMSNLLGDIEIGLINPTEELARLFPERQHVVSQREATVQLFAHYKAERDVPANQRRPPQFWAGNNVLRALAQLKREPIYVIDELKDGTAHVQRYLYRDFTLSDNEEHETGVHEVLSDAAAAHIFQEYLHCGVVPVILVLDHAASHFWAVNHGGLLREWNGRPGNTMRERMNEAHKLLNDVELDWNPLKMDVCAVLAAQVERDLHADIDGGDLVTETSETVRKQTIAKGRAEPRPGERPSASVYTRILASASPDDLPRADREWYAQVVAANQAATALWRRQRGLELGIPQALQLTDSKAFESWMADHPDACRSLFQVLPYPEVAAKQASTDFLLRWGAMEVFAEQNAAISMLAQNMKVPEKARDYCQNWLQAMDIDSEIKTKLAGDGARWRRLCKMVANVADRSKPEELDKLAWHLLHLLPYTLFNWQGLIIGTRSRSLRAKWYAEHATIRELCSAVVERNDWGAVTKIPEAPLGPKSTATGTNGVSISY